MTTLDSRLDTRRDVGLSSSRYERHAGHGGKRQSSGRPKGATATSPLEHADAAMRMILVTRGCTVHCMDDLRLQELEGETVFPQEHIIGSLV